MLDYGRKFDLEELADLMKNARSVGEREKYEKTMYKLVNQSTTITSFRNELIKAMRVRDTRRIRYIQEKLARIRQEETGGTEIS